MCVYYIQNKYIYDFINNSSINYFKDLTQLTFWKKILNNDTQIKFF